MAGHACTEHADVRRHPAGKSAALIMRRMSAQSMQAARQLEQEQLVQQLSDWSMEDAPLPIPEDAAQAAMPSSPGQASAASCIITTQLHVRHRQYAITFPDI